MKKNLIASGILIFLLSILNYSCNKEKPVPPTVTTDSATEVTYTTAVTGGNVTAEGSEPVSARGVCWNTAGNPTTSDNILSDNGSLGVFTSNLTGLTPNTIYYVRAYATNSGGTSYGDQVSFTTIQVEIPVLTTTDVTSITQTTSAAGGEITDDKGGSVTVRGVCWSTSENPTTSDSKTSDGTGTGIFSSSLTGLTGNTTYYVRAYATNSAGTGYGSQVSFKTSPVIPTVNTTEISGIGFYSGTTGGNITSDGGSSIIQRGVCWSNSQNPTTSDSKTIDGAETGTFISNIDNLLPGETYYLRAFAANSVGTGYGEQIQFKTVPKILADTDGNNYDIILIGNQFWFKQNLKTTKYNNGDPVTSTTPLTYDISGESEPEYQWPAGGSETNVAVYGRLYTWYSVNDSRNLCPAGWHVPTLNEWMILINYLGGEAVAGDKLKEAGTDHWPSPNNSTNESEFTALPGGDKSESMFRSFGYTGNYWTSTYYGVPGGNAANYIQIDRELSNVVPNLHFRHYGYSVRCMKDN
ncbi:MAG: FISUMP domain-containing protein [Methanococcaceae archaeon]